MRRQINLDLVKIKIEEETELISGLELEPGSFAGEKRSNEKEASKAWGVDKEEEEKELVFGEKKITIQR